MTTLAHRSTLRGPQTGRRRRRRASSAGPANVPARVAAADPGVALLAVAVAAAIGSITSPPTRAPPTTAISARPTTCSRFDGTDPRKLQASLDPAREIVRNDRVIGHRSFASPAASRPWISARRSPRCLRKRAARAPRGSYPVGPGRGRGHGRGGRGAAARDRGPWPRRRRRTIVGIVENPSDLSDEFALVSPRPRARRTASRSRRRRVDTASIDSFSPDKTRSRTRLRRLRGPRKRLSVRPRRWPCSPSRPSSSSWPRWSPPQASQSSLSDGSASSASRRRRRHGEAPPPRAVDQRRRRRAIGASSGPSRASRSGSSSPRRSRPRSTIASTRSAFRGR